METTTKTTKSAQATMDLASEIGARLKGGELIELVSDLGGGKTTLTKGLAKGAGYSGNVTSPTFTLQNEYAAAKFTIHHLDFYRLSDPGIMRQMLAEIMQDKSAVVVIEWAGIINDTLPRQRLRVEIKASQDDEREITISYPEGYNYLIS
jgi:tRNA threonylcarbamoyladenosine biosynthesis protein TsaE